MSHKQNYQNFLPGVETYIEEQINAWRLSNDPNRLKDFSEAFPHNVRHATDIFLKQAAYHTQINLIAYKMLHPIDPLCPNISNVPPFY